MTADEGDYAAWQAYRELDRMPDPSLNPCEHCEQELEHIGETIVTLKRLLAEGVECWGSRGPQTAWELVWLEAARAACAPIRSDRLTK